MLFVGIDVAKSKHDCCIIDSDGVIYTNSLRIANSKKGFESLYSAILSALTLFAHMLLVLIYCDIFK